MFTVKAIRPSGEEFGTEAESWEYHNREIVEDGGSAASYPERVELFRDGRKTETISFATVYIMNSNGKTVAKYEMQIPPQHIEGGSK